MSTERAGEVAISERLQLVDEFIRRQQSGESINMSQFAEEQGIPPKRFRQWCSDIKKQREAGMPVTDSDKKRNRQPKYRQIEDEMRQWMATHDDPTSVPPRAIRAKAIEIASRLGVGDFSASDKWIKSFRKRCLQGQKVDEAAAVRMADGFIGPTTDLSRQATTCPPDDDAAASDRPLDTQSQPSERNTMSVWSRSSAKSVFTVTADDRLSDIPEDDNDRLSVSDGAAGHVMAVSIRSTTHEDDKLHDPQMIVGSRLTSSERTALRSLFVPSMLDECKFTLLYRASVDGATYGDLLQCVGDASGLAFIIRKDKYVFGSWISAGIRLPDDPRGRNEYDCDGWQFSLAGHFEKPTITWEGKWPVCVAGRDRATVRGARVRIGPCDWLGWGHGDGWFGWLGRWLGYGGGAAAAADIRSCRRFMWSWEVPEGYVGVRNEAGRALFGGSEEFMADEMEVIRVDGLLSLKVIEGTTFDPFQSSALYRFLGPAMGTHELKLIYRASRDGASYDDLLRCVGDTKGLVFIVRRDMYVFRRDMYVLGEYVFGAFISGGIRLPDDPKPLNVYQCDGCDFSLAGHFDTPKMMKKGSRMVGVAGREVTMYGAKLWISGTGWLWLGCEGGAAADMRICRQRILSEYVPDGYVGVRDEHGSAMFGGSRQFMADEVEVLEVV
ncbi:unnamed protein product [Vitrella brassicaformis CCMP3155]|uniref:HTH CENPB-type domain-containing protein n=1 Tax=Vitrella brassicaformis (strain CCMP3155) TaxID=1169540 RepID=A0A0G4ELN3_VITBC|nr:unnamed protein product [Vitrella brassicaformis CCMP3155]|eukprot:CEL98338.1 unnamed protein product [Vitrella brassicaformis CCMP3155]